jgi:putative NADPH-quinone reductase
MQSLVVVAHPCHDGFARAAAGAAVRGLEQAGHAVDRIDLDDVGFTAAMSRAERQAYHGELPIIDEQVADHAARLQRAEIVVFVYPTWWSGLPAIMKGWLDRVMVPGVGFRFDEHGKVKPGLQQVRRIVGITTWASRRPMAWLVNDNGRRMLTRNFRMACGWRARTAWLALYGMADDSDERRRAFLDRIERRTAKL